MVEKIRNEARRRRAPLREAAWLLELAIAAPAGTGSQWRERMKTQLEGVREALDDHIRQVERPGGLVDQITMDAPRMINMMKKLLTEHDDLHRDIASVLETIQQMPEQFSPEQATATRIAAMALLGSIVQHRHKGADLLYEAYNVDIGGE